MAGQEVGEPVTTACLLVRALVSSQVDGLAQAIPHLHTSQEAGAFLLGWSCPLSIPVYRWGVSCKGEHGQQCRCPHWCILYSQKGQPLETCSLFLSVKAVITLCILVCSVFLLQEFQICVYERLCVKDSCLLDL